MKIEEKLLQAHAIMLVTEFLELGKKNDFISTAEAAGIFKDVLKQTGFKNAQPIKIETTPKEEAK